MLATLSGIATLLRIVQPWNASFPMLVTLLPIVTFVRILHPLNALGPMLVTPLPMVTVATLHHSNADFSMTITLSGIATLSRPTEP